MGRFTAVGAIGRGLDEAPVLRQGLGVTWLIAAVGAGGRVVVPIVVQQAIDRGIFNDSGVVDLGFVAWCALAGVIAQMIAAYCQRTAIVRLGTRSERALTDLRTRLVGHIPRLSLADHNEERRGSLVARVTSDIETLAEFFRWGGLALLINSTLMLIVAGVMLAYNWVLALIVIGLAIPLFAVLQVVQRHLRAAYDRARERNSDMLSALGEVVTGAETIRAYEAGELFRERTKETVADRRRSQVRANVISACMGSTCLLYTSDAADDL